MPTLKRHSEVQKCQTSSLCFLTSLSSRAFLLITHADRAFGRLNMAQAGSSGWLYFNIVTYFPDETEYLMRKIEGVAWFFPSGNLMDLKKQAFHSAWCQSSQQDDSWRGCSTQAVKLTSSEKKGQPRGKVHFQILIKDYKDKRNVWINLHRWTVYHKTSNVC